jgi:hypothetical protein
MGKIKMVKENFVHNFVDKFRGLLITIDEEYMKKMGLLIFLCCACSVFGMNNWEYKPPLAMPVPKMPGYLDPREAVFIQQIQNNEWVDVKAYEDCLRAMGVPNGDMQRALNLARAHNRGLR